MKSFVFRTTVLSLLVLLAFGVAFLIFREKEEKKELTLYGNVDVRLVDIGFRVPGKVEKLFFEEGDYVEEGELLALLDKTPYNSELAEAQANVKAAIAGLENAQILFARRKELVGIGGVSEEDLDNAKAHYEELLAKWMQAKANQKVQEDNLSYTEVFAPTSGIILTRIREPGSVVNPADPVLTLSVASPVWVRAFVSEKDLGNISYGMRAEISTDTQGAPTYQGKIGFISPMAEFTPKTVETTELRTDLVYRLRIYVDNPDWRLKQGMPVTVTLKIK